MRYWSVIRRGRLSQFLERMSGRLTPPEVTPLDSTQLVLLPIADLVMILMFSRPPGGSLRTARVTLVTIWLAAAAAAGAGGLAVILLLDAVPRFQILLLVAGLLALGLAFGSGVLALFGIRQRRLLAAARRRVA